MYFPNQRIAIFIDGDFWHGRLKEGRLEKLPEYWQKKIRSNMERDARQLEELLAKGIRPFRFFASDFKKDPESAMAEIERLLGEEVEI